MQRILVKLKGRHLDVIDDDNGKKRGIEVWPTGDQSIEWELSGTGLQGAQFVDDPQVPGFSWVDTPDPAKKIFNRPAIYDFGRRQSIDVKHTGVDTKGEWVYMLRVLAGDKQTYYTTTHDRGTRNGKTVNNPLIINKVDDGKKKGRATPRRRKPK